MLCFIIPLKARAVSRDWSRVEALFHRTLGSVCGQTDSGFHAIAVGHDRPETPLLNRPGVTWRGVSSPVPERGSPACMTDKWFKVAEGLVVAAALRPSFVMVVDADDLVSNRLAGFVKSHREGNGWMIRAGYRYREGSRFLVHDENFNCGTNAIVSTRHLEFPAANTAEERRKCLLLQHGHTTIERAMAQAGHPLASLPFPGAVYVWGHGDNDSYADPKQPWHGVRYLLGQLRRSRPLTPSLRREFNL